MLKSQTQVAAGILIDMVGTEHFTGTLTGID